MREKSVLLLCAVGLACAAIWLLAGCASSTDGAPTSEPRYYTATFHVGGTDSSASARFEDIPTPDYMESEMDEIEGMSASVDVPRLNDEGQPTGRVYRVRLGNDSYGTHPAGESGEIDGVTGDLFEHGFNIYVANESGNDLDVLYGCTGRVLEATAPEYNGSYVEVGQYTPVAPLMDTEDSISGTVPLPMWTYPTDADEAWDFHFGDIHRGEGGPDLGPQAYETAATAAEEYLGFQMVFPTGTDPEDHEDAGMLSFTFELQWTESQGSGM